MSHRAEEEDGHLRCAGHEGQGSQVQGGGRGPPHLHFKQRGRRCNWEGNKEYVFSWGEKHCHYGGLGLQHRWKPMQWNKYVVSRWKKKCGLKQCESSFTKKNIRGSTATKTANTVVQWINEYPFLLFALCNIASTSGAIWGKYSPNSDITNDSPWAIAPLSTKGGCT